MSVATRHEELLAELERLGTAAKSSQELMRAVVERLARLPAYNWVGFYMLDPADPKTLVLGPFVGADTPHKRIPLDQGICGAAAASGQTLVVDDVYADPRYLACSLETRSEIVAPVFVHGRVAGEIDIDSHTPAAFGPEDRALVERSAAIIGHYLEKNAA
ncbi:MAG TPA: GAF domain-containing protein [Terriglobales bacterium]|nr:GAF domain-containing protein [Terriglobales bacterium]